MNDDRRVWAILVAAGSGSRMSKVLNGEAKQFMQWRNLPLYWHSALVLARCPQIVGITFVFPEQNLEREEERIRELSPGGSLGTPWNLAAGGPRRQDSVFNGLQKVPLNIPYIAVHDAARPFLEPELVGRICNACRPPFAGAVPGLEVTDTIKILEAASNNKIEATLVRDRLRAVQTPQVFEAEALRTAHASAARNGWEATDDASLLEQAGFSVCVVAGEPGNRKITTAEDLAMLDGGMQATALPCTGFGYDVHRFGSGRPLKLGGVLIPGAYEVIAHSDGDVLLHALVDAILGCACLGDIGKHFPDSDPALDGISSAILLDQALRLAAEAGTSIYHADLTVVAQKPRLEPWRIEIKNNVARLLGIPANMVNFKATTEEKLGFTGSGEGIKAYAIVSCWRRKTGS